MRTVTLKLEGLDQPVKVGGLTMQQSSVVKGYAENNKMRMVISLLAQGVIEPAMSFSDADQFCIDHPTEAAQIASEVIRLTVRK